MLDTNPKFLIQVREVRFVSIGQFGGFVFAWLDILDSQHASNSPRVPYGWHARFCGPDVPIAEVVKDNQMLESINWDLVSRNRNEPTEVLMSYANRNIEYGSIRNLNPNLARKSIFSL